MGTSPKKEKFQVTEPTHLRAGTDHSLSSPVSLCLWPLFLTRGLCIAGKLPLLPPASDTFGQDLFHLFSHPDGQASTSPPVQVPTACHRVIAVNTMGECLPFFPKLLQTAKENPAGRPQGEQDPGQITASGHSFEPWSRLPGGRCQQLPPPAPLVRVKWCLAVVSICISLMTNEVEHLFMCVVAICIFPTLGFSAEF